MNVVLFEDLYTYAFLPLTYTRPVFDLRIGIDTVKEKWERYLNHSCFVLSRNYLKLKYKNLTEPSGEILFINGRILPDAFTIEHLIHSLSFNRGYVVNENELLAFRTDSDFLREDTHEILEISKLPVSVELFEYPYSNKLNKLDRITDIFTKNGEIIRSDFEYYKNNAISFGVHDRYSAVYHSENVFVEEGASIRASVINAEAGPIYIGKNAQIYEGSVISGSHAICEGAVIQPGTRLRGDSTIGPFSKVGGEIANSVIWGYTNKSHDGYLGNSILGEWCNIGAGTNVSNLKNNYGTVKIYNHKRERYIDTCSQFCGLIMGDYCRTGIGTMFNTGTVADVCINVFGAGFPPKHIPSFSWHSVEENEVYDFEKALKTLEKMKARRNLELTVADRMILLHVFEITAKWRKEEYI